MGQVTLKIENTYLCFLLKYVLYPWEASQQSLDQCPAYSKPFYFQQSPVFCSLFGVVFTWCFAGLCQAVCSWNPDNDVPKDPATLSHGAEERAVSWQEWVPWACPGPCIPLYPGVSSAPLVLHIPRVPGHQHSPGRCAVINHPIRSQPFPSAPSASTFSSAVSFSSRKLFLQVVLV